MKIPTVEELVAAEIALANLGPVPLARLFDDHKLKPIWSSLSEMCKANSSGGAKVALVYGLSLGLIVGERRKDAAT